MNSAASPTTLSVNQAGDRLGYEEQELRRNRRVSVEKEISVQSAGLAARHVPAPSPSPSSTPAAFMMRIAARPLARPTWHPSAIHIHVANCAPVAGSSCNQLADRPLSPSPSPSPLHRDVPLGRCARRQGASAGPIVMHCCAQVSMALWPSRLSPAAGLRWIQWVQQGASAWDAFC